MYTHPQLLAMATRGVLNADEAAALLFSHELDSEGESEIEEDDRFPLPHEDEDIEELITSSCQPTNVHHQVDTTTDSAQSSTTTGNDTHRTQ